MNYTTKWGKRDERSGVEVIMGLKFTRKGAEERGLLIKGQRHTLSTHPCQGAMGKRDQ